MDTFSREQAPPPRNANSFCEFELGRHGAILGSFVAANSNSVKAKHYYLALNAIADLVYFLMSQELRAEAQITFATWKKHRVDCDYELFTPGCRYTGKMKVSYAMMTEEKLIGITKTVDPKRVLGTAWQPGEPSPYMNPMMLRMIKTRSPELVISLHDKRSVFGHFSQIATVPIAILRLYGILLCRQLLGTGEERN